MSGNNPKVSLKINATKKCVNGCGMCFYSPEERENSPVMTLHQIETAIQEGNGAYTLNLMTGEFDGFKEQVLFPVLRSAAKYDYPRFKLTTSGIHLYESELDKMLEVFSGEIFIALSVDGGWGHRNAGPEFLNGDVLLKFINMRDKSDGRVEVFVQWTHKSGPKNDSIRDAYKKRCEDLKVQFGSEPLGDFLHEPPKFGETLNPWKLGLDSKEVDNMLFAWCNLPNKKHPPSPNVIQVGPSGDYYFCQSGVQYMKIGEVGQLGEGGLVKAVENFYQEHPVFTKLMQEGGVIRVAKSLLETEHRYDVVGILNQKYPGTCGICNICRKLEKYFPLLETA